MASPKQGPHVESNTACNVGSIVLSNWQQLTELAEGQKLKLTTVRYEWTLTRTSTTKHV